MSNWNKKTIGRTANFIVRLFDKTKFSSIDKIWDIRRKRTVKRWLLLLPGGGCAWAKKSGGCYMCGFSQAALKYNKSRIPPVKKLWKIYQLGKLIIGGEDPQVLAIYNAGSFLNKEEIPLRVQSLIAQDVAKNPSLETLFIESRPEFVTDQTISNLTKILLPKRLKVAIGLECESDEIRAKSVHKGFRRKDFERAIKILNKNKADSLAYVLLKPIYLSEKEAIDEAVKTIKYAFEVGVDEVALEAAFVQEGTKMASLYRQGKYSPPWLWSIAEVIKRSYNYGPIHIGAFEDEPPPIAVPYNRCPLCNEKFITAFKEYNLSRQLDPLLSLSCQCKKAWEKEMA